MSFVRSPRRPEFTEQGQGRDPMKESTLTVAGSEGSNTHKENSSFAFDEDGLQNLSLVCGTCDDSTSATGEKVTELNESYLEDKLVADVKRNNFTDSYLDHNEINRTVKSAIPEKSEFSVKNTDEPVCPDAMNCIPEKCELSVNNTDEPVCPDAMKSNADTKFSEEKELAFLRDLGWDEHAEEEPLTEEEISSFYQQHDPGKPGLQLAEARIPTASSSETVKDSSP